MKRTILPWARALAVGVLGLLGLAVLAPAAAWAEYPDHPIRLVVPAGAGGITDLVARILGEKLGGILRQPIVIDNKVGASGIIGSQQVATAKPDGYTLLMAFPTHVANPSTIKAIPYDTVKDFAPVAKVGQVLEILVVGKDNGIDSMKTLLEKAAQARDTLTYGSVGTGSQGDLCTLVFQNQARVKMLPVTYKSEPEMVTALIRNDLQVAFVSPPVALPMIKGDKVRALAISSGKRSPLLPNVPTVAETGLAGYDVTGWNAIFAPAGTPPDVIAKLNKAINQVLAEPAVVEQLLSLGVPALGGTPEELQQSVVHDIDMIGKTLAAVGFKPQ
jgi:tripartite-type tricarboxylate transporter receptor subunit TctC